MLLLLSRATPLTPEEAARLPEPAVPVNTNDGVVARAQVDLPLPALLLLTAALARSVPDAVFSVDVGASLPAPPPPVAADPWELFREGKYDAAIQAFSAGVKDADRDRLRPLFNDPDPDKVVFACKVARLAGWKSAATNLRMLTRHPHPAVREAVAVGLGELAGPSVVPSLRPLLADGDAQVRAAAAAALKRLGE